MKGQLRPNLTLATGLYRINPEASETGHGFDLSFKGTGFIRPLELVWRSPTKQSGRTEIKLGGYYNTSQTPDVFTDVNGKPAGITRDPFEERDGRWGGYLQAKSMIYREADNPSCGIVIFGIIVVGDPHTAKYGHSFALGARYQGTFPGRDKDSISFIIGRADINGRLTAYQRDLNVMAIPKIAPQTAETLAEISYNTQLTETFAVRPNIQYFSRPGGRGDIPAALVFGFTTRLSL